MPAPLRVLIADDHPSVVRSVSRLLAMRFAVVGSISDGSQLLETVRRLRPEVVVLDVNLPQLDGLTACRQLVEALPEARVVVFSAGDDPAVRRRALDAGALAFVDKLSAADTLFSLLEGIEAERDHAAEALRPPGAG